MKNDIYKGNHLITFSVPPSRVKLIKTVCKSFGATITASERLLNPKRIKFKDKDNHR